MIKNPACTPEQVARNLRERESITYEAYRIAYLAWQNGELPEEDYNKALNSHRRALADIVEHKRLNPSAFLFEEFQIA